jgi:hypothetical protein
MRNKTDKADARGLAQIVPLKCGSLCPANLRNRHHPSRCPLFIHRPVTAKSP